MNILSLYDGMACGHIAFMLEEIPIDRYVAYEIDGYAVKTAVHNFPDIEQRGDVFDGDFTEFEGFDWLIGGSPCTYWSIAQKNNRETEASGLGWELFCQYTRALREAKPKFFIYENNKSMSKAIRESITEAFGFEPVCINSALVSAQNRQRLYWVGRRNDDGTYSKVDVPMPEDRGILLKDILEAVCPMGRDKSRTLTSGYVACSQRDRCMDIATNGFMEKQSVAEPVNVTEDGKARTLIAGYHKQGIENCCGFVGFGSSGVAEPVNITADGKSQCLRASCYKDGIRNLVGNDVDRRTGVAESVCVAQRGRYSDSGNRTVKGNGPIEQYYEARDDGKTNALTTVQKDNAVCEPVRVGCMPCYATPCEWDEDGRPIKAVPCADGKVYTVYEVKDRKITIKGKEYPIKLVDGFYIIRKLTVRECMRLQTVPEWYEFPVSDTQAYKMLGNGWTVEVIRHLIRCAVKDGEQND